MLCKRGFHTCATRCYNAGQPSIRRSANGSTSSSGGNRTQKEQACLSFWYLSTKKSEWPVAAEFSYDYDLPDKEAPGGDTLERYPPAVVQRTNDLLAALEKKKGWVNLAATTKTAYAYKAF